MHLVAGLQNLSANATPVLQGFQRFIHVFVECSSADSYSGTNLRSPMYIGIYARTNPISGHVALSHTMPFVLRQLIIMASAATAYTQASIVFLTLQSLYRANTGTESSSTSPHFTSTSTTIYYHPTYQPWPRGTPKRRPPQINSKTPRPRQLRRGGLFPGCAYTRTHERPQEQTPSKRWK